MRLFVPAVLAAAAILLAGCSHSHPAQPTMSAEGSMPAETLDPTAPGPLEWERLETVVARTARDHSRPIARGDLHRTSVHFAEQINQRPADEFEQYHVDRAAIVLEREGSSATLLAEGANLRGRATSAGSRGTGQGSSGRSRDIGRTPGTANTPRSNGFNTNPGSGNNN